MTDAPDVGYHCAACALKRARLRGKRAPAHEPASPANALGVMCAYRERHEQEYARRAASRRLYVESVAKDLRADTEGCLGFLEFVGPSEGAYTFGKDGPRFSDRVGDPGTPIGAVIDSFNDTPGEESITFDTPRQPRVARHMGRAIRPEENLPRQDRPLYSQRALAYDMIRRALKMLEG